MDSGLRLGLILLILASLAGCDFPRDPEGSFEGAATGGLRVGLVENPPYVASRNGGFGGTEIDLIQAFADRYGLRIRYTRATESELIEALKTYDVHLLAGGFDKNTIWASEAGVSTPYDGQHVLLVPRGENKLLYRLERYIFETR